MTLVSSETMPSLSPNFIGAFLIKLQDFSSFQQSLHPPLKLRQTRH
jgi:hypothetical protein